MIGLIQNLVMTAVVFLMLGVGLQTTFRQIFDVIRQFQLLMRGIFANFLIIPAVLYLGIQWSFLTPEVGIGLMVMAAAPVAPMAPPFVGMAKGDLPYAVGLMTVVALLCVPLTPLILSLCVATSEQGVNLDIFQMIQTILIAQLIPISIGMAINHLNPDWREKLVKFVPKIGQCLLVISIILIIGVGAKQMVGIGLIAHLAIFLAVIISLLVGDWMMLGETTERRRSLSISTAIRNPALGLLIATGNFPGTDAVAVVLVYAIYSMIVGFAYGKLMFIVVD
jgi:bile acid:Na+ symporter, BASS family